MLCMLNYFHLLRLDSMHLDFFGNVLTIARNSFGEIASPMTSLRSFSDFLENDTCEHQSLSKLDRSINSYTVRAPTSRESDSQKF